MVRILAGYDCGVWETAMIQDLILTKFKVKYSPRYIAELLKNMGFSYQRARFVSHHIDNVAELQEEWMNKEWTEIIRLAKEKGAMILFGDEAIIGGVLFHLLGLLKENNLLLKQAEDVSPIKSLV